MKIDKNIIKAVREIGHDRIIIHPTGVYSCRVTPDTKFGDRATRIENAAIVYGVKSIVFLGDIYLTAPFGLVDLKNEPTA